MTIRAGHRPTCCAVPDRTRTRTHRLIAGAALALTIVLTGCGGDGSTATSSVTTGGATVPDPSHGIRLVEVAAGLDTPVQTVALPGPGEQLLVVEQAGRVRTLEAGTLPSDPVLDISGRVKNGGDQGPRSGTVQHLAASG